MIELDSLESALIEIANLKYETENDSLETLYLNMIIDSIEGLEPLNKVDLLTRIFEQTVSVEPDLDLFLIVAETYEQLKLYSEANDIYRNIIRYNHKLNSSGYKLKIALNLIHKKDYDSALVELKPIITSEDSLYIEEALFYDYIVHYALDDYQAASHSLLRLYYKFPENDRKSEIIAQLSNIYFEEKQYVLSWYWLEQLYKISDRGEQSIILQKIKRIKLGLAESKNDLNNQFKYFKPIFEMELVKPIGADSLKTEEKESLILEIYF